jgi:TolA-binding protein
MARLAACVAAAGLVLVSAASAQTTLPPPAFGNADARQDRIEELETQLREANAENERLQLELRRAQSEIQRLSNLVGEMAGVNQSLSQGQPAEGAAPPNASSGTPPAQTGGLTPQQQAATGTLGTLPADQAAPADAGEAYGRARQYLVNGNYAEAEAAFGEFLQRFPNTTQTADARFWFAYTLLARNNYRDAAANFVQYLQTTPNGPRGPESQVRLGMALAGLAQDGENDANDLRQACGAFASLQRRYPNAPRNIRDLAAREARAARCPA